MKAFDSDEGKNSSVFFFIPNKNNTKFGKTVKMAPKTFIYYDSPADKVAKLRGCSMNERFIFFWNEGNVYKINVRS
jgi:hypothetical protein